MKILGIMWEENSTAALMVNGETVACVSQERFSRIKNDERYPKDAIDYVLKAGGIKAKDLDAVAFMGRIWSPLYVLTRRYSHFSIADYVREQEQYWYPLLYEGKRRSYLSVFKDKLDLKQYPGSWQAAVNVARRAERDGAKSEAMRTEYFQEFRRKVVQKHLGIDPSIITFVDHPTGHAMYAYYASPLREDAAVITADAWGDNINATVSVVRGGKMRRLKSTPDMVIARLYRYLTLVLGMKPNEHEYKVMGLAPYAKRKYFTETLKIFEEIQAVDGLGFRFKKKPRDMYFYFRQALIGARFDAIAGALQEYTEKMLTTWTANVVRKTGLGAVVFAGGVAMNVKANMLINTLPSVKKFFVNPSPSDESQAIGACCVVMYDHCIKTGRNPGEEIKPLKDAYLGPAISNDDVDALIEKRRLSEKYKITRNVAPSQVAAFLAGGKVIARAAGRSEFGARALGNRSIIADPRDPEIVKVINDKIKNRDFWMPFAATVLETRARDYLVGYKEQGAPFMTVAFDTTAAGRQVLRAGLHPSDMTCRPQVLKSGVNPGYEAIIKEFERLTGVGALLNTSFNLHGEPIVQTAQESLRVFELSDIDGLLLNDVLIEKMS